MKRSRDSDEEVNASVYDHQDVAATPVAKMMNLDTTSLEAESSATASTPTIQCSLPGHTPGLPFASYSDYEEHYVKVHTNRCLECTKNFPTSHVLELHICENHDALARIRRERGEPIYACLVETCYQKFTGLGKRQNHLVGTHKYPSNYFFAVTKFGIDGRKSMLVDDARSGRSRSHVARDAKPSNAGVKPTTKDARGSEIPVSKDTTMDEVDTMPAKPQQKVDKERAVIAGSTSPIHRRAEATSGKVTRPAVNTDMDELVGAMSTLRFIPRAVRLGPKTRNDASHQ
ncbi:hypothetical protein BD289DRAFT_427137 [Coniella lustricola]|uniref:C2H2-type domain-containing protein n=1 Tax=Coniella lustricola TaxID=2025994 RepID=A0A2T3AFN3_9PEZI|nr:hypothetical protein BD289DRAFT_427137 [Coniella lustricola]